MARIEDLAERFGRLTVLRTAIFTVPVLLCAYAAAPTLAGANRPVAPKPFRAGRFGMVRTTAISGPNQRARAACGIPAAHCG